MNPPSGPYAPLGTQAANEPLPPPASMRRQLLEAMEEDLGPTGIPTQTTADAWLKAFSDLIDCYMTPLVNYSDEVWNPPHSHISLLEVAITLVLRLKDSRHLFLPERCRARKIIPTLVAFYVLLEGYDASGQPDYDEYSSVTGAQLQKLIFEALVMYLCSAGDNVKPRIEKGNFEEDDPILLTTLDAFLHTCDELLAKRETLLYPCMVPVLAPGRIQTRLDDEEPVTVDHVLIYNERQAALLPTFSASLVAAVMADRPCVSDFLMAALDIRLARSLRATFMSLISGCWPGPSATISRYVTLIFSKVQLLNSTHTVAHLRNIYFDLRHQLLLFRISVKDGKSRILLDAVLEACVCSPPSSAANCLSVLRSLARIDPDDHNLRILVVRYFTAVIPSLDKESIQALQDGLPNEAIYGPVAESIGHCVSAPTSGPVAMDVDDTTHSQTRSRIVSCLRAIITGDQAMNLEDIASVVGGSLPAQVLWLVDQGSPRAFDSHSLEAQVATLRSLIDLPCLLVGCSSSECHRWAGSDGVSMLSVYIPILSRFAADDSAPPRIRKQVFKALSTAIRHHAAEGVAEKPLPMDESIMLALTHKSRPVRLAAGHALVESIRLYELAGTEAAARQGEHFFDTCYRLLSSAPEVIKETILVTVGAVAKATGPKSQCVAVCCLVSQLGDANPILRGLACTQLMSLAGPETKLYRVLSPYIGQIAEYTIRRWQTQPMILTEFCRTLNVMPHDFVRLHLTENVPKFFAERQHRLLSKITKEMGYRPRALLRDIMHEVIAHIFLLPAKEQTDRSLEFLVKYISDSATGRGNVYAVGLVKSHLAELLAALAARLGDEDEKMVHAATEALLRVDQLLTSDKKRSRTGQPKGDPKGILRANILSVTSQMTDMLQELKFKVSVIAKRRVLRSFGYMARLLGQEIGYVAPQIMLAFQAALGTEFSECALESWLLLLQCMAVEDIAPHLGFISAVMVHNLSSLTERGGQLVRDCLDLLVVKLRRDLEQYFNQVPDLEGIPMLATIQHALRTRLRQVNPSHETRVMWQLERARSDNISVVFLALRELKTYMVKHREWVQTLALGDLFHPLVGRILSVALMAASRDGEGAEVVRRVAYECIGALGAVDPDRCDIEEREQSVVVIHNFADGDENAEFATHLIANVLVPAFRSTGVLQYQKHLSFAMQELCRFCRFTPALVSNTTITSVAQRVRRNWQTLTQKNVLDVITPLLDSKFTRIVEAQDDASPPFYSAQPTYREWLATWTAHLVKRVSEGEARTIFGNLEHTISKDDVSVAYHLLPHLVLNAMLSREPAEIDVIRAEILVVLEDQVKPANTSARDKRLLSAQVIFLLMDHIQKWLRFARTTLMEGKKKSNHNRRDAPIGSVADQISRVDSVVTSVDQNLVAEAAFRCKAYARSLMSFEQHVVALRARQVPEKELQHCYDRIHEIYSQLDDADGMAGISTLILEPSLEHQIREHESNGRWTSAQSCWELSLQQSPDSLTCHKGLLHCLRHLGHYDTLRTHVKGLLVNNPEWKSDLVDFQVEGAWNAGAWEEVRSLVAQDVPDSAQIAIARVLVAMQSNDREGMYVALGDTRRILGEAISAAGPYEYRRAYDSVLNLHALHEMETVHLVAATLAEGSNKRVLTTLSRNLRCRLESTQPFYRVREPLLSMRRVVFALCSPQYPELHTEIGKVWLTSAKFARKAGHMSAAYSALIQAQHRKTPYAFIQDAKLVRATGDSARALRELEHSIRLVQEAEAAVIDLTTDANGGDSEKDLESRIMMGKAELLRGRWARDEDKFSEREVIAFFNNALAIVPRYESASFYCGQYHDALIKPSTISDSSRVTRAAKVRVLAVRSFMKAIKYGTKFTYQTVPRLLTIWLDMGEDDELRKTESFRKVMAEINRVLPDIPAYKWYTAFPQIASRVGHPNAEVWKTLSVIVSQVIAEYPQQALWQFAPVIKSRNTMRSSRGKNIIQQLSQAPGPGGSNNTELRRIVSENMSMVVELLCLCDLPLTEGTASLSMKKDVPKLMNLAPSRLILPLQESLVASLPPTSSEKDSAHQPFPLDCPTFAQFYDEIDVMKSLARPRKITILGSDGKNYMFLGKPKDDLRKDARLMDFNALINKLLKANSESRKRQLYIRTYAVVTLNEECGFIQWVPNTTPMRPVISGLLTARGAPAYFPKIDNIYKRITPADDKTATDIYLKEVLPLYPTVFHEWYIETFPEPSTWLNARRTYGRTLAVMSIVGWILGLGDRHTENILLDKNTGAIIHVDFNCLFERGKLLVCPERVPFRLTPNLVAALGIVGVEGVYRNACEVSFEILRDNSDTLMSVLDAFVHDPLVEWEDEKRRQQERHSGRKRENAAIASADLKALAHNALDPIQSKLSGKVEVNSIASETRKLPAKALVEVLIQQATDIVNLANMYPGWTSWM
ncbi:unnamed protein product [Peniophora sp. CBMAI 1063]|nr:unnamed protein product [Peniophora sp. CBMAI 1063]